MIGEEIFFSPDLVLKILSYDSRLQKVYFKQKNKELISSSTTQTFLNFDNKKIKHHFDKLLFKYEIGEVLKDKNRELLILDRFKYGHKKFYKVKCCICNYSEVIDELTLKEHDYSCSCCYGKKVVVGVNDIPTTAPWMVDYFQGGYEEASLYTSGSSAEIFFKCPYCNKIKETATKISVLSSNKRLNCSCMDYISYPEKFMRNFLADNNIDYMYQIGKNHFSWCKKYIYDFYIPSHNLIIETHGAQHYDKAFRKITVEEQKEIDKEKQSLAEENGFIYMCIDCKKSDSDYIYQNIKNSQLMLLLKIDETNIDIKELDSKCRKNILKEICAYYNQNIVMPQELADKYKLDITTIYKYLHIGTKIGWCNYNSKENLKKGMSKTHRIMTNAKKLVYGDILVFNNNQLIGKFNNQYDTAKELNKIGITISVSSVGQALKRENHKSKGLLFYYENEITEKKG